MGSATADLKPSSAIAELSAPSAVGCTDLLDGQFVTIKNGDCRIVLKELASESDARQPEGYRWPSNEKVMKTPIKEGYSAVAYSQVCANGVYVSRLLAEGSDIAVLGPDGRALKGEDNRPYRYKTMEEAVADVGVLCSLPNRRSSAAGGAKGDSMSKQNVTAPPVGSSAWLAPFVAVAKGIPDNWPGECILRFDQRNDGSIYLGYHGINDASGGITINQWRALIGANAELSDSRPL